LHSIIEFCFQKVHLLRIMYENLKYKERITTELMSEKIAVMQS